MRFTGAYFLQNVEVKDSLDVGETKGGATSKLFSESNPMYYALGTRKEYLVDPFLGDTMSHLDILIPHRSILTCIVGESCSKEQMLHYIQNYVVYLLLSALSELHKKKRIFAENAAVHG
ncbi:hypothetical protein TNCV_416571 [Trichonephila clavipes]|nr:hypothetical protein TNCV_416571 [Trichonephila clavipes]